MSVFWFGLYGIGMFVLGVSITLVCQARGIPLSIVVATAVVSFLVVSAFSSSRPWQ